MASEPFPAGGIYRDPGSRHCGGLRESSEPTTVNGESNPEPFCRRSV
jgi:hypothetical protein